MEVNRGMKLNRRVLKETATGYGFIGFSVIGVLIFWTLPLIFSVGISFSEWDFVQGIKGIKFVGLENYVEMWKDEWFLVSLKNNIIYTISYVPILMILSFFVALLLKDFVYGQKLAKLGLYSPYIVNVVAVSAVWMALFSRFGPIVTFLQRLGMENPPIFIADIRFAMAAVVLISVWGGLGYTSLLFLAGLVNIPEDLYEAAQIDGANGLQRLVNVTIPMLSPTTFFITVTSIIGSFKVFGIINIMTQGGPGNATTMLVYNIYRTAFRFGKMGFAAAQGIVLLIMILTITLIQFYYQNRFSAEG
jgi:multiple sugar transport system permease protein